MSNVQPQIDVSDSLQDSKLKMAKVIVCFECDKIFRSKDDFLMHNDCKTIHRERKPVGKVPEKAKENTKPQ